MEEKQIQQLSLLIQNSAWTDTMLPALQSERDKAAFQLQLEPGQRPGEFKLPDQWLRGYLAGIGFAMDRPKQWINEWQTAQLTNGKPTEPESVGSPYEQETTGTG